jgi:hypothetical protein
VDAKEQAPKITLEQISVERIEKRGNWKIGWQIKNVAPDPVKLRAVRLPHGQFKSEQVRFEPPIDLPARQKKYFQVAVRCEEPAGLVTENGFVIFQIDWRGEPWRVFVRVRVVVGEKGEPRTTTELITTQKVGFTGVNS